MIPGYPWHPWEQFSSGDIDLDLFYLELNSVLCNFFPYRRRVTTLEWHPTAENILLSTGMDHKIIIWNVAKVTFHPCHENFLSLFQFVL